MATIPNTGLARAAQVILGDISHAAVGSGTTAEAVTDTTLAAETDRLAPTSSKAELNMRMISEDSLLTIVLRVLSQRIGTVTRPLKSACAAVYT